MRRKILAHQAAGPRRGETVQHRCRDHHIAVQRDRFHKQCVGLRRRIVRQVRPADRNGVCPRTPRPRENDVLRRVDPVLGRHPAAADIHSIHRDDELRIDLRRRLGKAQHKSIRTPHKRRHQRRRQRRADRGRRVEHDARRDRASGRCPVEQLDAPGNATDEQVVRNLERDRSLRRVIDYEVCVGVVQVDEAAVESVCDQAHIAVLVKRPLAPDMDQNPGGRILTLVENIVLNQRIATLTEVQQQTRGHACTIDDPAVLNHGVEGQIENFVARDRAVDIGVVHREAADLQDLDVVGAFIDVPVEPDLAVIHRHRRVRVVIRPKPEVIMID